MDARAACRTKPDIFFGGKDTSKEAIAICMGCPIWDECVIANMGEQWGVWGCSERARRRIRKLAAAGGTEAELLALAWESNVTHVGKSLDMVDRSVFVRSKSDAPLVS
jgi:hypothetical protein